MSEAQALRNPESGPKRQPETPHSLTTGHRMLLAKLNTSILLGTTGFLYAYLPGSLQEKVPPGPAPNLLRSSLNPHPTILHVDEALSPFPKTEALN